ncbi:MAG: TldD/PmbA family protein [Candidatus Hodarchaeota archaeon]
MSKTRGKSRTKIDQLHDLALKCGKTHQFDDVVVTITSKANHQIRFAKNEITVSKTWESTRFNMFASKDQRLASIELLDLKEETIQKTIDELAVFLKRMPQNSEYQGIAHGEFKYKKTTKVFDSKVQSLGEEGISYVRNSVDAALSAGAKDCAGVLYFGDTLTTLSSNHNIRTKTKSTNLEFNIRAFSSPQASGQGLAASCILSQFDVEEAGAKAGEIAKMAQNGIQGQAGTYDVILSPAVAADLIGRAVIAGNTYDIEAGFSFLRTDQIGEQITYEGFTAYDDGLIPNGLGSRPFDDEGHPTQRTKIYDRGVLKAFIHNTSTAKRYDSASTGNAGIIYPYNHNVVIEPGDHSFDELLEQASQGDNPGLYITANWYTEFSNYAEGSFSSIPRDGMFLVKKGEISQPVVRLRISDSLPQIMKNLKAIGKKELLKQIFWWEVQTPTFISPVLVEGVKITAATK